MPIRLDASKTWIEESLASHAETARLGLVECSSDLVPEVNRQSLASFTLAAPHPLLYISTTKREKWRRIPLGCGTESVRWTLTDQDLCEVSELECHDTSFRYQSPPTALIARVYRRTGAQDNNVAVHRMNTAALARCRSIRVSASA